MVEVKTQKKSRGLKRLSDRVSTVNWEVRDVEEAVLPATAGLLHRASGAANSKKQPLRQSNTECVLTRSFAKYGIVSE